MTKTEKKERLTFLRKRRKLWMKVLTQVEKDIKWLEQNPKHWMTDVKCDGVCNYLRRAGETDIEDVDSDKKRSMMKYYPEFARFKPEKTYEGGPYWWSRGLRGTLKRRDVVTKILENLEAEMQAFE